MKKWLFLLFIVSTQCVPLTQTSGTDSGAPKVLQLEDLTYESQIKTVRVYPQSTDAQSQLLPAVTKLGNWALVLEFDDFQNQRDNYYARVIHCNQDWTKSSLSDLDFMPQYNEFPLLDFNFSLDTHVPYVHYTFRLPAVKLSGNYVLVVYRNSDRSDIVLSKRFMVYESRVTFRQEENLLGAGSVANMSQQVNFAVNYKNIDLLNPMDNIHVTMRQNQRWDNLASGIKPSFLRENTREIEYKFFDPNKIFKGNNEFRWFDLKSILFPGRNVLSVDKSQKPFHVFIQPDASRQGQPYANYNDLDDNFLSANYDYSNPVSANYAYIHFTLQSPQPIDGKVYLSGSFTNWRLSSEYQMTYDGIKKAYTATAFLRQGYYDYQYVVQSPTLPPYYFEGSHFDTENQYEIFVYYRSFQPQQADLLIGYLLFVQNPH